MVCFHCGAVVGNGDAFCSSCGARMNAVQPRQMSAVPPAQPPPVPPVPPARASRSADKPPHRRRGLWAIIAAAALIVVAVIVLFVWPGVLKGGGGPLSGDTVQTRFYNDSAAVFTDAFSGLGESVFADLADQPFQLSLDLDVEAGDEDSVPLTLEVAYDGEALGASLEGDFGALTLLLLEDVLYAATPDGVSGLELESGADLTDSMTLAERLGALTSGSAEEKEDMRMLLEAFMNSIDEDCFQKSASEATLTMDADDIADALRTLADKVDDDRDLRNAADRAVSRVFYTNIVISDTLESVAAAVGAVENVTAPGLEYSVMYEDGRPIGVSMEGTVDGQKLEASFGYNRAGDTVDMLFTAALPDGSAMEGTLRYQIEKDGLGFGGEMDIGPNHYEFSGEVVRSGDDLSGRFDAYIDGFKTSVYFDGNLTFGKLMKTVEKLFKIDTRNANVYKLKELLGSLWTRLLGQAVVIEPPDDTPPEESPPPSTEPIPTLLPIPTPSPVSRDGYFDGTLWVGKGTQSGGVYTAGEAICFSGGMAYIGTEGMSYSDIIANSSMFNPHGDLHYTFDGTTIHITATDGVSVDYYYDEANNTIISPTGGGTPLYFTGTF